MLRIAKTSKLSVVLAGLLLALAVLFTGESAHAASKPLMDLQAPLGGEVFSPGQEILIRVAPQGKVTSMQVFLDIYDSTGTTLVNTVSPVPGSISNIKPTKFKLHQDPFTLPTLPTAGLPSSHCRIRLSTTTKLGTEEVESGDFIIGSPGLLPNSVDTTHIIDGAIQTADIGTGEVTTTNIKDGDVQTVDIADKAVTGAKLLNDATDDNLRAVTTNHIKDKAVTSAKLQSDASTDGNRAVTTDHIRDSAVTANKILDGAVTTNKIADGNVSLAKLNPGAGQGLILITQNAAPPSYVVMNGDATINPSGLLDLNNNAVETSELADSAVTNLKLANDAVTTAKILDGQITSVKIANSAVQTANILDGAVDTAKIKDNTILASDLESTFNASLHRHTDNKDVALVGNTALTIFLPSTGGLNGAAFSGANLIGVFNEFTNASSTNLQTILKSFDTAISAAAVNQNVFTQLGVSNTTITADSSTTAVNINGTNGIVVTGNNGVSPKTITIDLPDGNVDSDTLNNSIAGDGLVFGVSPRQLNVAVQAPLSTAGDVVHILNDGIDGTQLANTITVDAITQTFTFPDDNSPAMLFKFPALLTTGVPIFKITRNAGTVTLFTLNSTGDLTIPGLFTAGNGVNVSGGFLSTGPVLTPNFKVDSANGNTTVGGTLEVTGGLAASSLSSKGDFTVGIDSDNNDDPSSFTVQNNNATETLFQVTRSGVSSTVTGTIGFTGLPGSYVIRDGAGKTGTLALIGALGANRNYALPDKSGTVAMLTDVGTPIAPPTLTSTTLRSNGTAWIENTNFTADGTGTVTLGNGTSPSPGKVVLHDNVNTNSNTGTIQTPDLSGVGSVVYTLPNATGTLELTSDLKSAAAGGTGANNSTPANGDLLIGNNAAGTYVKGQLTSTNLTVASPGAGQLTVNAPASLTLGNNTTPSAGALVLHDDNNANANTGTVKLAPGPFSGTRTYLLPDASGTFLLASGGALTLGDDSVPTQGALVLHDNTSANTFTGTIQTPAALGASATYTLPAVTGTLARLADITSANFSGTLGADKGGTGADNSSPADGNLLIGNNGAGTYVKAALAGTPNQVTVTNGPGSITLSTPQSIGTASTPTFGGLTLGDDTTPTAGSLVFEDDQNGNGFQGTIKIITGGLTTDQTYSLPNTSGTLAVKADIDVVNLTGILSAAKGGTGADNNTPANGQILVGDGGAGTYKKATLGSTNLTVTGGAGTLSINTPQDVASTASPTFAGLKINSTNGAALTKILKGTTSTQNLASLAAGVSTTFTITVTGALVGDTVFVSPTGASNVAPQIVVSATVSAADTVTVQLYNTDLINPIDADGAGFDWSAVVVSTQ